MKQEDLTRYYIIYAMVKWIWYARVSAMMMDLKAEHPGLFHDLPTAIVPPNVSPSFISSQLTMALVSRLLQSFSIIGVSSIESCRRFIATQQGGIDRIKI